MSSCVRGADEVEKKTRFSSLHQERNVLRGERPQNQPASSATAASVSAQAQRSRSSMPMSCGENRAGKIKIESSDAGPGRRRYGDTRAGSCKRSSDEAGSFNSLTARRPA